MSQGLEIGPLQADQIERAYIVIQASMPTLPHSSWHAAVGDSFQRRRFSVAADVNGYVRGLCLARTEQHPTAGRLLDVPIFIIISPIEEDRIAEELFEHIKRQAIANRCSYLRFWTMTPDNWKRFDDTAFKNRWDHGLMYCIGQSSLPVKR